MTAGSDLTRKIIVYNKRGNESAGQGVGAA